MWVRSGKDVDKFREMQLEKEEAQVVNAPVLSASPVNIVECKVKDIVPLGSHHMFVAEVVNIMVDNAYMEESGRFALEKTNPLDTAVILRQGSSWNLWIFCKEEKEKEIKITIRWLECRARERGP